MENSKPKEAQTYSHVITTRAPNYKKMLLQKNSAKALKQTKRMPPREQQKISFF